MDFVGELNLLSLPSFHPQSILGLVCCIMGSKVSKKSRQPGREDLNILRSQTPFSVNEVEALYELYKKLSKSVINDGFIQKAELQLALFKNSKRQNLFADRIFYLFDVNKNGHIEFGEFVQSLSVFHPKTPEEEKIKHAFRLYDLRHTGYIEHEELKEMVLALLSESDLSLSDDIVETIVDKVWSGPWLCSWMAAREHSFSSYMSLCVLGIDFHTRWYVKTFREADLNGDGRIDQEEWKEYVARNPSLLRNMTLPYLMDITLAFPSFVLNTETEDSELGD